MKTYEVRRDGGITMLVGLTWQQAKENAVAVLNIYNTSKAFIYCEQNKKLVAIYHKAER